jgi:hypothetical protein
MQATLKEVAAHCDGVRCDMAMLVLNALPPLQRGLYVRLAAGGSHLFTVHAAERDEP